MVYYDELKQGASNSRDISLSLAGYRTSEGGRLL
jgi:hypothetical protein